MDFRTYREVVQLGVDVAQQSGCSPACAQHHLRSGAVQGSR